MNIFKKIYCRTFQGVMRMLLPLLPYREPKVLENNAQVVETFNKLNCKKVFFVTDKTIRGLGLTKALEEELSNAGLGVVVFDEVLPNPTISLIEKGRELYQKENCDCLVALGGGSVIDCAKTVGARIVKPNQSVRGMKGLLKINKKLPPFVAIPTTAGTGSETTIAAVITDDITHHKYAINDFSLIPHYALLDYNLTIGLNQKITSTTGMDALTHAVEAFIGRSTTKGTRRAALHAIKLICQNLEEVCVNPTNAEARQNMLKASYLAGVAFTKSYVGYVHAVAHTLGGAYGVPHGLANAIILPVVLRKYETAIHSKLATIAKHIGLDAPEETNAAYAEKFIEWIENFNKKFNIPTNINVIDEQDIPKLAKLADKEANPLYPVPVLMDATELENIYYRLSQGVK